MAERWLITVRRKAEFGQAETYDVSEIHVHPVAYLNERYARGEVAVLLSAVKLHPEDPTLVGPA